jgi:SAM-dependent methyltransferase
MLPREPLVLDACGGSGNASLLLHDLGTRPVTVDVSREMLAIYEEKARRRDFEPETHVAAIESFLASDHRAWDLIVFSSALHHLDDYELVLELAAKRLRPGGVLTTIFDPTQGDPLLRALRRFDYALHLMRRTPAQVPRVLKRNLTAPRASHRSTSLGELAERHAWVGIDDWAVRRRLEAAGVRVILHQRLHEGRFRLTRLVSRILARPTSFSFIVQRPCG